MPQGSYIPADLTTFISRDKCGLTVTGQPLDPERAILLCFGRTGRLVLSLRLPRVTPATPWSVSSRTSRRDDASLLSRFCCAATSAVNEAMFVAEICRSRHSRAPVCPSRHFAGSRKDGVSTICPRRGPPQRSVSLGTPPTMPSSPKGQQLLIDISGRLDGVTVLGVDEQVWRRSDKYVTVDLTSHLSASERAYHGCWR